MRAIGSVAACSFKSIKSIYLADSKYGKKYTTINFLFVLLNNFKKTLQWRL